VQQSVPRQGGALCWGAVVGGQGTTALRRSRCSDAWCLTRNSLVANRGFRPLDAKAFIVGYARFQSLPMRFAVTNKPRNRLSQPMVLRSAVSPFGREA
jgi:hypothetical protein